VSRRIAPRRAGLAVTALTDRLAPKTLLAEVQREWVATVGEAVAREATPTAERAGVLTVTCRSSVWAQELDLMGPELVDRLNAALGTSQLTALRCTAAPTRGWARPEAPEEG
jgi:predicted nucleic acid-binding Zn ribbon protein